MKKLILSLVTITFLGAGLMLQAAQGAKAGRKAGQEQTIQGTAVCTKCQLHETDKCGVAIQVTRNNRKGTGKETTIYLEDNDVVKALAGKVCEKGKPVTVTGTVKKQGGKQVMTATKIEEGQGKTKGKGRKKA
jgi:Family of unknown function (DUF6370)